MTDQEELREQARRDGGVDVFYSPDHGSVVEVYGDKTTIVADIPGEGLVSGEDAASVLYACLDSDDVDHRRIEA